jgi:archaellum component FlaC
MAAGGAVQTEAQRIGALEKWRTDNLNPWRVTVDESINGVGRWRGGINSWQSETEGWKNKHNGILEALPEFENQVRDWKTSAESWQTDMNTWRNKHTDILDELPKFERDVKNSLHSLTTSGTDHSAQLRQFGQFASEISPRVANLESWKGKTDSQIDTLFQTKLNVATYKTARDELEEWKKLADMKLDTLYKSTANVEIYNANKNKWTKELNAISGKTDALAESYAAAIPPMKNRLESLEGRTKDLEARVTKHDDKIKGFEGGFTKLGLRIDDQGKKMGEGFGKIERILEGLGCESEKRPHRSLSKYQSNSNSPGGINVANYGQLSVPHAPNCTYITNSFNSNFNTSIRCPCQTIFQPEPGPPAVIPYNAYAADPLPLGPFIPRSFELFSRLPGRGSERNKRSSWSGESEGSYAHNHTPGFTLNLDRTSGGGLFSKPKKEQMSIVFGKGGAAGETGRRKHRGMNSW